MNQDQWWIDYLEDDIDYGMKQDLEQWLEASEKARANYQSYRTIKEWVRASDWVGETWQGARLTSIKNKVLAELGIGLSSDDAPKPTPSGKRRKPSNLRGSLPPKTLE